MISKHFIIMSLTFMSFGATVHAQDPAMEARAAYLLAEESFEAGKYADCINFLEEAGKKLGNDNAKILYLKILSLQQLSEKDEKLLHKLQETIGAFEKVHDISSFNEEKQLEITKLKLKVARRVALVLTNKLEINAWMLMRVKGWKLGMHLDELTQAHPGFFSQTKPLPTNGEVHYTGTYNGVTISLILREDGLREASMVVDFMGDNKNFEKGKQGWQTVNNALIQNLGQANNDITSTDPAKEAFAAYVRTTTWVVDNRKLALVHTGNSSAKTHTSLIQLKISQHN